MSFVTDDAPRSIKEWPFPCFPSLNEALLPYVHHSRWSIGHLRPLTIALCSGLLWPFQTSWSLVVSALLQCLASNCSEAGLSFSSRKEVSLAASFRLSLHCIISLRDGDPSLPRRVLWFAVVDAFVTNLFLQVGWLALRQPLYLPGELVLF